MLVDHAKFAFEFRVANIPENGAPDGTLARAGSNQRERARRKQVVQAIG
jgi:hypothetical protein